MYIILHVCEVGKAEEPIKNPKMQLRTREGYILRIENVATTTTFHVPFPLPPTHMRVLLGTLTLLYNPNLETVKQMQFI
jgi:hypothetical protein